MVVATPAPPAGDQHDPRQLRAAQRAGGRGHLADRRPSLAFGVIGVLGALRLDELERIGDRHRRRVPRRGGPRGDRLAHGGPCSRSARHRVGGPDRPVGGDGPDVLVPLAGVAWLLALLIVMASPSYGTLWVPGMALISEGSERVGLDQGFAFAIFNMAWAAAQVAGSAGGAALAQGTSDGVAYGVVAALCAGTLAAIMRWAPGARSPSAASRTG